MHCALCNEPIEIINPEYGEVYKVDGEYWHAECYAEYFEVALESV